MRTLKELGRSYLTITKDVTRVMNRNQSGLDLEKKNLAPVEAEVFS